jgi:hypothetical protein
MYLGNVDLRRAGLLAGGQGLVFLVEDQQALGHGFDGKQAFGAGRFSQAPQPTHLNSSMTGKPFGTHVDGIELAGFNAIAHAQATDGADPLLRRKGRSWPRRSWRRCRRTCPRRGRRRCTGVEGFQGFGRSRIHAHDIGDIDGRLGIGDHADAWAGLAFDNGHGRGSAAGKPQPPQLAPARKYSTSAMRGSS